MSAIQHRKVDLGEGYNPLDEGWNERIDGKRQGDNPFAINNWKHYEWEKGWLSADLAIKNDSPEINQK